MKRIILVISVFVVLIGLGTTLAQFEDFRGRWLERPRMPSPKALAGAAVLGNKIYVVGGLNSDGVSENFLSSVEAYDFVSGLWEQKTPLPGGRYGSAVAAVNGKIYVMGGVVPPDGSQTKEVWEYNPAKEGSPEGPWTKKHDAPYKVYSPAVAVFKNKIYIFGGMYWESWGAWIPLADTWVYDPPSDSWERKADIAGPARSGMPAVVVEDQIYLIGGDTMDGLFCAMAVYNPETGAWATLRALPEGCGCASLVAAALGHKIYLAGGRVPDLQPPLLTASLASTWQYDPLLNKWQRCVDLPFAVTNAASVVSSGRMFILGGSTYKIFDTFFEFAAPAAWEKNYQEDFSSLPGWISNSPKDLFWNSQAGNYHFLLKNGAEQSSFIPMGFDPKATYILDFDVLLTRNDWAADFVLGFGDADMNMNSATTWFVSYHKVDQGQTATLIAYDNQGNIWHPGGIQPIPFELNVWYHNEVLYDGLMHKLELTVTKKEDKSLVGKHVLTGLGDFQGLDRLYLSSMGHTYSSGSVAEGFMDNLRLLKLGVFIRGDANGDSKVNIADAVFILGYLFQNYSCKSADAMDTNDDGVVNISDALSLLHYLFYSGPAPKPPFPDAGLDLTEDKLTCGGGG